MLFSKDTGEIFHIEEDNGPKDMALKLKVLNFLRSIRPEHRFSKLGLDVDMFDRVDGSTDFWINSVVDLSTGEILADKKLNINDPVLSGNVRKTLQYIDSRINKLTNKVRYGGK